MATAPPLGLRCSSGTSNPSSWTGQLSEHSERLGGEGLMDLPDVDVGRGQAGSLEGLGDGEGGRDPHELGVEGVGGRRHHPGQRFDSQRLAPPRPLARTTALAPSLRGEELPAVIWVVFGCGRKGGQLLGGGVSPDDLVVLEGPAGALAGARDLYGMDLGRQAARISSRGGMLVGAQGEGVDLLSGQLVAVGHVLGRLDHLDVGIAGEQARGSAVRRRRPTWCRGGGRARAG